MTSTQFWLLETGLGKWYGFPLCFVWIENAMNYMEQHCDCAAYCCSAVQEVWFLSWKRRVHYLLTYLLTPCSRVLLDKLRGFQLVKKFPAFYGTRRFITAFTSARHLSLSPVCSIQSIHPHPTSWRSILIISFHLLLGFSSGLFPSGFPTKIMYTLP